MVSLRAAVSLEGHGKIFLRPKQEEEDDHLKLGVVVKNIQGGRQKQKTASDWSSDAVTVLLNSYSEKFALGKGSLRGKDWEEVLADVNACAENLGSAKTMKQCKDKVDSLKRRYKIEKHRVVNGNAVSWPFFEQLDNMMAAILRQGKFLEPCISRPHPAVSAVFDDSTARPKKLPDVFQKPKVLAEEDANLIRSRNTHPQARHMYGDALDESVKPANSPAGNCENVESRKRRSARGERFLGFSNVVTGLSHVAARIEAVKLQIVSHITYEMEQLHRMKRRKK